MQSKNGAANNRLSAIRPDCRFKQYTMYTEKEKEKNNYER